jgi:hypothetical protein
MAYVDFVALKHHVTIEQTAVLLGLNTKPAGSSPRLRFVFLTEGDYAGTVCRPRARSVRHFAGLLRTHREGREPSALFPNGFNPASAIFNAHRITKGELYLVRDPFQVLQAFESGTENVGAFLTDRNNLRGFPLSSMSESATSHNSTSSLRGAFSLEWMCICTPMPIPTARDRFPPSGRSNLNRWHILSFLLQRDRSRQAVHIFQS